MADFYGILIASSFRVKDEAAFKADPDFARLMAKVDPCFRKPEHGYWAFGWEDQYPSPVFTAGQADDDNDGAADNQEEKEYDMLEFVRRHIQPEDACVVMVSGNEKLRYGGMGIWVVTADGVSSDPFGSIAWDQKFTRADVIEQTREFAEEVANAQIPLVEPLGRKKAKEQAKANDGRVKAVIAVDLSDLDGDVESLNDLADEEILGKDSGLTLMDISYRVVGHVEGTTGGHFISGTILLEVSGELDDDMGDGDDDDEDQSA